MISSCSVGLVVSDDDADEPGIIISVDSARDVSNDV